MPVPAFGLVGLTGGQGHTGGVAAGRLVGYPSPPGFGLVVIAGFRLCAELGFLPKAKLAAFS